MFKVKRLTWVIGCALVLNGCALPFQSKVDSLNDMEVKPVERISHSGSQPKIMYLLGRYYQGKVQYKQAIDAYQKALDLNPNYVEVHNSLAVIYAIQKDFDKSFEYFAKALEIAPNESYLNNNMGYAFLIQGKEYEAAEAFKRALQIDPYNEQARTNLVTASQRLGLPVEEVLAMDAIGTDNKVDVSLHPLKTGVGVAEEPGLIQAIPKVYELSAENTEKISQNDKQKSGQAEISTKPVEKKNNETLNLNDVRIEVSNGNGVTGMAKQISLFLEPYGATNVRLTNHQSFYHPETEIYYRTGHAQFAKKLNHALPQTVKMVESNDLRSDIQVKILLGNDFSKETAHFNHAGKTYISVLAERHKD